MGHIKNIKVNEDDISPITLEKLILDNNGNNLQYKLNKKVTINNEVDFNNTDSLVERFNIINDKITNVIIKQDINDNNLLTENKNIISSINEINNISDNSIDKNIYNEKITELENLVKQIQTTSKEVLNNLIEILNKKGESISPNATFDEIANVITNIECNNLPTWYSNVWVSCANLTTIRSCHASILYKDKIYSVGGYNNSGGTDFSKTLECYDPNSNASTALVTNSNFYRYVACIGAGNNCIYTIGGGDTSGVPMATNTCCDVSTYAVTNKTSMTSGARMKAAYATVDNNIYIIAGENNSNNNYVATNSCYNIMTDSWSSKTDAPYACQYPACCVVGNKIYFAPGYGSSGYSNKFLCYDTNTNTWTEKSNDFFSETISLPVLASIGNTVYIKFLDNGVEKFVKYDTLADTWDEELLALETTYRNSGHTIVSHGGVIYLIGGVGNNYTYLNKIECYIP